MAAESHVALSATIVDIKTAFETALDLPAGCTVYSTGHSPHISVSTAE